jgi:hypothetical protein
MRRKLTALACVAGLTLIAVAPAGAAGGGQSYRRCHVNVQGKLVGPPGCTPV